MAFIIGQGWMVMYDLCIWTSYDDLLLNDIVETRLVSGNCEKEKEGQLQEFAAQRYTARMKRKQN